MFLHRLRREQREFVVEYQVVSARIIRQRDIHVVHSDFAAIVKRRCWMAILPIRILAIAEEINLNIISTSTSSLETTLQFDVIRASGDVQGEICVIGSIYSDCSTSYCDPM